MEDENDEDQEVAGDELSASEDDHHEAEGNAETAKDEVVLAGGSAPASADLGGHQGAHAEVEAAEDGEEEELAPAVLGLLTARVDELLKHLGVGELLSEGVDELSRLNARHCVVFFCFGRGEEWG